MSLDRIAKRSAGAVALRCGEVRLNIFHAGPFSSLISVSICFTPRADSGRPPLLFFQGISQNSPGQLLRPSLSRPSAVLGTGSKLHTTTEHKHKRNTVQRPELVKLSMSAGKMPAAWWQLSVMARWAGPFGASGTPSIYQPLLSSCLI